MTQSHTAEPWTVDADGDLIGADGLSLFSPARELPERHANLDRIAVCVNRCEGMKDPARSIAAMQGLWYSHFPNPPSA